METLTDGKFALEMTFFCVEGGGGGHFFGVFVKTGGEDCLNVCLLLFFSHFLLINLIYLVLLVCY